MTSKTTWLLARLAGTAGLLGLLCWKIDLTPLHERMHFFQPRWYLFGLATILLYVVIQASLLRTLLTSRGLSVRLADIIRMIFISSFFGMFLPGGIGADAALCYALFRSTTAKETVLSSIVFARTITLMGMTAIAIAADFLPNGPLPGLRNVLLFLIGVTIAGFMAFAILWRRQKNIWMTATGGVFPQRLLRFVFRTIDVLVDFGCDARILFRTASLALLICIIRIGMDYISAASLGLHPPLIDFFLFTPAVTVATTVPLTVAGLGVREGSYVYLFSLVGVAGADALSISLLSFSFTLWVSLIGAIVYVTTGLRASIRRMTDQ